MVWLALGAMLLGGLASCGHLRMPKHTIKAKRYWAHTQDGWALALHRLEPQVPISGKAPVVVVCHGLASNRHNWDLGPGRSLPHALAALGMDVWSVELRGSGDSVVDAAKAEPDRFDFDSHVQWDVPALIQTVRKLSQASKIHWVGHSMGGMLMYAYLGMHPDAPIASWVAVGSPGFVTTHLKSLQQAAGALDTIPKGWKLLPAKTLAWWGSPLAHLRGIPATHLIWAPDNVEAKVIRRAAAFAVSPLSVPEAKQLLASSRTGKLLSADGKLDYTAGLKKIQAPALLLAGVLDGLAPPGVVLDVWDKLGSTDKKFAILGKGFGHRKDYGHVDLAVGDHAQDEVYPMIADWITRHSQTAPHTNPQATSKKDTL